MILQLVQVIATMQVEFLNKHLFLTAKPVIYLVNLSERDYIRKKNKWLEWLFVVSSCCFTVWCVVVAGWLKSKNGLMPEILLLLSFLSAELSS